MQELLLLVALWCDGSIDAVKVSDKFGGQYRPVAAPEIRDCRLKLYACAKGAKGAALEKCFLSSTGE